MDVQKFTGAVISVVVVVIIGVTVLVPIIASNQVPTGDAEGALPNGASINAMLNIIPLLVVVGIIIAVIAMFISKRN